MLVMAISNQNSFRVLFDKKKFLPYILFKEYIYILSLEMASWRPTNSVKALEAM